MRKVARTGDVQAPAFDLGDEVLKEGLRQPGVGVEEEDQVSLRTVASYIPTARDGRLAVEDCGGRLLGDAHGRVAGAGVDDDDFIGSVALALYIREQLTQVALLVERWDHNAQTHCWISLSLSPTADSFPFTENVKQRL